MTNPQSVENLIRLVGASEVQNAFGVNLWIARESDEQCRAVNLFMVWQKHYRQIVKEGGACVFLIRHVVDGERRIEDAAIEVVFPNSVPYMYSLFDEVGFGLNGFAGSRNGQYLLSGVNSTELVVERRKEALKLCARMESEFKIILSRIVRTSAIIEAAISVDRSTLERWACHVWEFFERYYQTDLDIPPVHSSRPACLAIFSVFNRSS